MAIGYIDARSATGGVGVKAKAAIQVLQATRFVGVRPGNVDAGTQLVVIEIGVVGAGVKGGDKVQTIQPAADKDIDQEITTGGQRLGGSGGRVKEQIGDAKAA